MARPCLNCAPWEEIQGEKPLSKETKRARLPKEDPMFCSLRCGFDLAVDINKHNGENELSQAWCEDHHRWYVSPWGCDACGKEEKES